MNQRGLGLLLPLKSRMFRILSCADLESQLSVSWQSFRHATDYLGGVWE